MAWRDFLRLQSRLGGETRTGQRWRATRDGCELSLLPTGEGDSETIRLLNLRKSGLQEGTDLSHIDLLVFRYYKKINRDAADVLPADESTVGKYVIRDIASLAMEASWIWLSAYYFVKMPGVASFKLHALLLSIAALSRTIGVWALPQCVQQ